MLDLYWLGSAVELRGMENQDVHRKKGCFCCHWRVEFDLLKSGFVYASMGMLSSARKQF